MDCKRALMNRKRGVMEKSVSIQRQIVLSVQQGTSRFSNDAFTHGSSFLKKVSNIFP